MVPVCIYLHYKHLIPVILPSSWNSTCVPSDSEEERFWLLGVSYYYRYYNFIKNASFVVFVVDDEGDAMVLMFILIK